MKHFYTLLYIIVALPLLSASQDLVDNTSAVKNYSPLKGSVPAVTTGGEPTHSKVKQWEKDVDQVNGRISRSSLAKMKSRTDALIGFLQDSCLAGTDQNPVWHGEYNSEKSGTGSLMKFGVQCIFDKANLTIMANDLSPLLDQMAVNNKAYFTMAQSAGVKNNCPYFEIPAGHNAAAASSGIWLVSTGEQQPYTIVTRKEYLQEAIAELNNTKNNLIAAIREKMPLRPLVIQEAERKATIDQLNNSYTGIDLQLRMRMFQESYKTDEAYQKESTEKSTATLDSTLHLMEGLLGRLPVQELARPAMVSVPAVDFEGFEDNLPGSRMLIRLNISYFSPDLSPEKPQLFLVQWSFTANDAAAAGLDRLFRERFDVSVLKTMLGR